MFQRWIHAQLYFPIGRISARKSATKLAQTVKIYIVDWIEFVGVFQILLAYTLNASGR